MSKNIRDSFFIITSNLGNEHEKFISTVGNLCPETNIISVNRSGIEHPGMLANVWNISKATFLITAESDSVIDSILNKLNKFSEDKNNFQTIKVDGLVKEFDPIYNSEKHLYALKDDVNTLSGNVISTINNFIESNTISYENVKYDLKQIFFAFKDSLTNEFNTFKELMHDECENLKSEYNYNVVEYKLREIFHEYEVRVNLKLIEYEDSIRVKFSNILNDHDEYKAELRDELEEHQNNINQQFENFRQYLLEQFSDFKFGTGIVERIESIEQDLNQFKSSINLSIERIENDILITNQTINNKFNILSGFINNSINEKSNYNENTFLRKDAFEGDGVILINNGNFTKLEKPDLPSVLTFDGNEFKWQPYKEYEL